MLSPHAQLSLLLAADSSRKQLVMGLCQDSASNLNDQVISCLCREEKGKYLNPGQNPCHCLHGGSVGNVLVLLFYNK